jgi:hypothetical protein
LSTLPISDIVLLDVSAEISVARMIARYFGRDEILGERALEGLRCGTQRKQTIWQAFQRLCQTSEDIEMQPRDNWHLHTALEVIDAEREILKARILGIGGRTGIKVTSIDAELPFKAVVELVMEVVHERASA